MPKNVKGGPFLLFLTSIVLQNIETNEGETLWWNPKKVKKSRIVPKKNQSEKHQRGVFRGSGRRCFCFGRGSGVSSMFWTSAVQADDVEQMNKKADRSR